jgi:hypothetical protein
MSSSFDRPALSIAGSLSLLLKTPIPIYRLSSSRVVKGNSYSTVAFVETKKKDSLVISPNMGERDKEMGKIFFFLTLGNLGLCSLAVVIRLSRTVGL